VAYKDLIDQNTLPKHIAIIMDGNGRWAKKNGKNRVFGHSNGVESVRVTTETCAKIGIEYLTLYAFSTENWNRPSLEINALMTLLTRTLKKETKQLHQNNIRLRAIGNLKALPKACYDELMKGIELTKNNTRLTLTLALSYSGRWEITNAAKEIALKVKNGSLDVNDITDEVFQQHLNTHNMPDPELLIRTSGELRLSNYMLWQMAYTEFYFSEKFWPDFRENDIYEAIYHYQQRERRFGKVLNK